MSSLTKNSDAAKALSKLGASKGGKARAKSLSPEDRSRIARDAVMQRWQREGKAMPLAAEYGAIDRPLHIGEITIPCYVLSDSTRVLATRGLLGAIGMSVGGGQRGERKMAEFMTRLQLRGIDIRNLVARINSPIRFMPPHGGISADGYEAKILPDICAVIIEADQEGKLDRRLKHVAQRAAVLQHGFSTVGIIALVDEATGYQADRARDALAKILEAFVTKELRRWVKTFPAEFYKELFRLREIPYDGSPKKPQYIGWLTNDLIYARLAPGLLEELKRVSPKNEKGKRKGKLFQSLTENVGNPRLLEHLAAVTTLMRVSVTWDQFMALLDKGLPRQVALPLFDQVDGVSTEN